MISFHIVVDVNDLPVSEVDSVCINVLIISMVYQCHLWWCLELTLEDADVVSCIVVTIETVFALEETDVLKVDGNS